MTQNQLNQSHERNCIMKFSLLTSSTLLKQSCDKKISEDFRRFPPAKKVLGMWRAYQYYKGNFSDIKNGIHNHVNNRDSNFSL